MAYQYAGTETSGHASVPRWIDDETGEEFLDFDGLLGPPPEMPDQRLAQNDVLGVPGYDPGAPIMFQGQDVTQAQAQAPPPSRSDTPPSLSGMLAPAPPQRADAGFTARPLDTSEEQSFMKQGRDPFAADEGVLTAEDLQGTPAQPSTPELPRRRIIRGSPGTPDRMVLDQVKANADPEMVSQMSDRMAALHNAQSDLAVEETRFQKAQLADQSTRMLNDSLARQNEIDEQEAQIAQQEQFVAGKKKKTDALVADLREKRVDANRLWANKDGEDKFLTILAFALGGISSGMSGGPNVAVQMYQRAKEQDINAQEANLATDREDAKSALGQLRRVYGSLDQAKAALNVLKLEQAEGLLKREMVGREQSQLGTNMQQTLLAIEKEKLDAVADLQNKFKLEFTQKRIPGRAGTRGGLESDKAYLARLKTATAINSELGKITGSADAPPDVRKEAQQYEKSLFQRNVSPIALQINKIQGLVKRFTSKHGDAPGVGVGDSIFPPGFFDTEDGALLKGEVMRLGDMQLRDATGAAAPISEQKQFESLMARRWWNTENEFVNALNSYEQGIKAQERLLGRAYPRAVQYMNRSRPEPANFLRTDPGGRNVVR